MRGFFCGLLVKHQKHQLKLLKFYRKQYFKVLQETRRINTKKRPQ